MGNQQEIEKQAQQIKKEVNYLITAKPFYKKDNKVIE